MRLYILLNIICLTNNKYLHIGLIFFSIVPNSLSSKLLEFSVKNSFLSRITILKYEIKEEYISYLRSIHSQDKEFFDRTILDHYEGCYCLLKQWGYDEKLCIFGLFHSVYEKHIFINNEPNEENRKKLANLVGDEVEKLIFEWDSMDRRIYITDIINHPEKQKKMIHL